MELTEIFSILIIVCTFSSKMCSDSSHFVITNLDFDINVSHRNDYNNFIQNDYITKMSLVALE